MTDDGGDRADEDEAARVRREPPPFRRLTVRRVESLSARMRRVVVGGPELAGFEIPGPASSVRLLLPPPGDSALVAPRWTGNQFELPGGERAPIRTFTPRHLSADQLELWLDIVVHEHGLAADWVRGAQAGDEVAVSGPGRAERLHRWARRQLLAGDETAIPAMSQLLETLAPDVEVAVHIEIASPAAELELPTHPGATITWHVQDTHAPPGDAFARVVERLAAIPDAVWVAGEAAAVQRVRTQLFAVKGLARTAVTARGYWKYGRSAT
jgi:NADPH-dependent ferric siderophore reductase